MIPAFHWRYRHLVWLSPTLLALLLIVAACGNDHSTPIDGVLAPAIDACSRVGSTGELAPCEDSAGKARERCLTLSTADRLRCESELDELLMAAQEGYRLFRGECAELTSDAARSACSLAVGPRPDASPSSTTQVESQSPAPAQDTGPSLGAIVADARESCGLGQGRDEAEDVCERALKDGQSACERLAKSERAECKRGLDGLSKD